MLGDYDRRFDSALGTISGSGIDGTVYNTDSDGNPNVFNVNCNDDGECWLNTNYNNADYVWDPDNVWVFGCCNSLHFSLFFMSGEFCFCS